MKVSGYRLQVSGFSLVCAPLWRRGNFNCNLYPVSCTLYPRQRGLSLLEVLLFIVVVGLAAAAVLAVFGRAGQAAAEARYNLQARLIARALLDEALAIRPAAATDCNLPTPGGDALGPEAGELRGNFNNVNDYHGFDATGLAFLSGMPIDADGNGANDYAGFRVRMQVAQIGLPNVAAGHALRVSVHVHHLPDDLAASALPGRVVMHAVRVCR